MKRITGLGSILASALLVLACGGTPESSRTPDEPTVGGGGQGGGSVNPTAGGFNLPGGGNDSGGGGSAGEAGTTGIDDGPVCGDGEVDAPETCDDGNGKPGDGCDGNCNLETGWKCPKPGEDCEKIPTKPAVCGNGEIESGESCDLGEDSAGVSLNDGKAGCSTSCQVVTGWTCPGVGQACTKDPFCGDSIVTTTLGEQCDDGTNDGAHGCDVDCKRITGWKCPPAGGACEVDLFCGNGTVDNGEQCDDHNFRNYDGCDSTCFIESGFTCPPNGGACERMCGNGKLDPGETCDDSNINSDDGCTGTCNGSNCPPVCTIEADYTCATVGQSCIYTPPPPPPQCGNGKIEGSELCDDGNVTGGDGCSSTCIVEAGWKCTAADTPCVAKQCGDGILAGNELCDDGIVNTTSGCTPTCTIAPNATCPANGGPCVPMVCGDGKVTGTETCDSGLNDGKHGCSPSCQIITGWACPLAGAPCTEICGDGIVVGVEQCDEQGDVPCCSASCKLKPNYVCDPSKNPHSQPSAPYCGNGTVNGPSNAASTVLGSEQCDDGNTVPFDGCSPTCTNEPLCGTVNTYISPAPAATNYQCFARCGDGLVLPPEQCDDGNTQNGDGCDSSCKVELIPNSNQPAWTCSQPAPGALLTLPVVWRDFSPRSHPQFEINPAQDRRLPNMTTATLKQISVGGTRPYRYVPDYNTSFASPTFTPPTGNNGVANWTMNGPGWVSGTDAILQPTNAAALTTAAAITQRFDQWYIDTANVNMVYTGTISLTGVQGSPGTYRYSCDSTQCDSAYTGGFFPIDGKGWVATNPLGESSRAQSTGNPVTTGTAGSHNYHFTTELRSWFAFKGGEKLAFYGDDDLWVFVNGKLVLDLGGIHSKINGNFTLNADGTATSCTENVPAAGATNCSTISNLGLTANGIFEIAIFNAERHVSESNFQLTLTGFNNAPSVCTPICGDGFVAGVEQCDRGNLNVSPSGDTYGKCTTECKLGPYCGDKSKQNPPEICDNGLNIDAYTSVPPTLTQCAPGCVTPSYCGDGVLQKGNLEECDNGAANQNAYGKCQTNCKLGARCGDGAITNGEACDDGPNNGSPSSSCDTTCKKKCGNGTVDTSSGEQCDTGTGANGNGSATSDCDSKCQFKCGNGKHDDGEDCDDGANKNNGNYGGCTAQCKFGPSCGDSMLQNPPEVCDNGAANMSLAYGLNSCTDQCLPGGWCGDGVINGPEKCDDGKNTGLPGSCTADCSGYVPSKLCGDGTIQAPEKCDDGNKNGTATSNCDTQCRLKCGNATVEAPEECDNGINDGTYGTCTPECKLAGYCGDGVKNGNEQCDKGAANVAVATAYGPGVCTKACKTAPICGDGKVQASFGEECEGNSSCMDCKFSIIK